MNLTVTSLFLEVALILLPGFIWMRIQRAYGIKNELSPFDAILNSFIFSIVTYLILAAIHWAAGSALKIISMDVETKKIIQPDLIPEILQAFGLSILLSFLWLYVTNYKWITRFLQLSKATMTYGDEDVWDFILNSSSPLANFVHVRDFEQQVVYAGDVRVFSETDKLRELLLEGVTVYDFDGHRLYDVPSIYLARNPEGVHIEFPAVQNGTMGVYSYTFPGMRGSANEGSTQQ